MKRYSIHVRCIVLSIAICCTLLLGLSACGESPATSASTALPVSSAISSTGSGASSSRPDISSDEYDQPQEPFAPLISTETAQYGYDGEALAGLDIRLPAELGARMHQLIIEAKPQAVDSAKTDDDFQASLNWHAAAFSFFASDGKTENESWILTAYEPDSTRALYPEETILAVHFPSEEGYRYYTVSGTMYQSLLELMKEYQYQGDVSFTGNYVELQMPPNPDGEALNCMFEENGLIYFVQGGRKLYTLDPVAGTSRLMLESADWIYHAEPWNGGFRLFTDKAVLELDSSASVLTRLDLPEPVQVGINAVPGLSREYCYDAAGQKIVYSMTDGVYVWENGASRKVLDNGDAVKTVLERNDWYKENAEKLEQFEVSFCDPQLLANGTVLCAVINVEQSQNGYWGLVLVNLETGETQAYSETFGILHTGVDYPDDNTVRTFSDEKFTRIDARTFREESIPVMDTSYTPYWYSYLGEEPLKFKYEIYNDAEGYPHKDTQLLREDGSVEKTLLSVKEKYCYVYYTTENYLLYHYEDSAKSGMLAVRYRD